MSGISDPPVTEGSVSIVPIVKSSPKGGKKLPKFHWSTNHRKLLRTVLLSVKSVVDKWKRFVCYLSIYVSLYLLYVLSIHLSIHHSIHPFIIPFIHSFIIPPFIHPSIHSFICLSSNPFIHVSIPPLSSDTDTVDDQRFLDNLTHKHNAHLVLNTVQIIVLVVDSLLSLVGGIKSLVTECCQISMKRKKSSKREVRLSLA